MTQDIFAEGAVESRVWIDDQLLQDEGIAVLLNSAEPAMPAMRNISVSVPGRHGAYDFGAYFEPREFTLNVVFPRQSYADLKYQIRQFVRKFTDEYGRPKTVKLRFGDEVDKYYNVRLTESIPVERAAERGYLSLGLTAYDPYAYSLLDSSQDVLWGDELVTFEWHYLLGMEGALKGVKITAPRTINVDIDGESLRPVIEINGSASSLTISANGKSFSLPAFSNTRWTIDGQTYEVKRGSTHDLAAMTGDFIELLNGSNDIVINGSGLNFNLTIKYRDKYI